MSNRPGVRAVILKQAWNPEVEVDHPLLDNWWQRVDDELAEWDKLGQEIRDRLREGKEEEKSVKLWKDPAVWLPPLAEKDGMYTPPNLSITVLARMKSGTHEIVLYDRRLEIWLYANTLSRTHESVIAWMLIPKEDE